MKKILVLASIILLLSHISICQENNFSSLRNSMVETQIAHRGISDQKVLDAIYKVKRHLFVPQPLKKLAYEDRPLPIGHGQTISQPYIVAFMTEAANLKKGDRVLEIGTGSGYQAAVLAEIVKEVYTIEIIKPLADTARQRLKDLGYKNIYVKHGDGYLGWPEFMPYDAIIVTAAPNEIPEKLVEQLKKGGRMIIPIGSFYQELYLIAKTEEGISKKKLLPVRFVPMVRGK
ncbi:MAG: protein-L-isoaspartate(D-aspartate) O-methyltransferase [Candidatus Omnitrophica bacterium]|nr:protein-L-isoaspartate(D-aspartate) O-methyltransferase [Candidatus Omnitrophota bacterium]